MKTSVMNSVDFFCDAAFSLNCDHPSERLHVSVLYR